MNLDGGIHEIPLADVRGRLWLCGKHAIGPDPVSVVDALAVDHVVCLVERFELEDRYPRYVEWLANAESVTWFPIADLDFVSVERAADTLDSLTERLRAGESVLAHCGAGIGRAGTLAVSLCLSIGMSLEDARSHVRMHRPGAGPEVGSQADFVVQWAARSASRHR